MVIKDALPHEATCSNGITKV